jgi:hypothetical protein
MGKIIFRRDPDSHADPAGSITHWTPGSGSIIQIYISADSETAWSLVEKSRLHQGLDHTTELADFYAI